MGSLRAACRVTIRHKCTGAHPGQAVPNIGKRCTKSRKLRASLGQRLAELSNEGLRCFCRVEMHCHCRLGRDHRKPFCGSLLFPTTITKSSLTWSGSMRPCRRIQPS